MEDPHRPAAVVTDVHERFGCHFVKGYVQVGDGAWAPASFTIPNSDMGHMSREAFYQMAARRLPDFREDVDWRAEAVA